MFRYETLHESWLNSCQKYLNDVFDNNEICNRTIIDYAFGRGNWAVAFTRCGAKRVIAVDASGDNCKKLHEYCKLHQITNIQIICGNLAEQDLEIEGDLLWLYGILHHIAVPDNFLKKITSKIKHNGAILAYSYNANSLREWIVSTARRCILFENETDFRAHSLYFTPTARMRARDDLVAPHIRWNTATEFTELFSRLNWHPTEQLQDFSSWLHGENSGEFNPYVVKLTQQKSSFNLIPQENNLADLAILRNFSELILQKLPASQRISFGIGLFNTYFNNFSVNIREKRATDSQFAWENFKYLIYATTILSVSEEYFSGDMKEIWDAAMHSLNGSPHKVQGDLQSTSSILGTLSKTNLRL